MGLFDWLRRAPKSKHQYTDRTARWMHRQIVASAKAGDALPIADAAAALSGKGMMAFGLLVTEFPEHDELRDEAIATLQALVPTMSDATFDAVNAVIQHANLPVDVQGRRSQRDEAKQRQVESAATRLRAAIADAGAPHALLQGYIALRHRHHDAFGIAVPSAVRDELAATARAELVKRIPDLTDQECDELFPIIEAAHLDLEIAARRDRLVAERDAAREAAIASAIADEPRNVELEATIAAQPDDAGAYSVLADWLVDRGHPRGELIALQLSAEADPALADAAERHLREHAARLLGPLEPFALVRDGSNDHAFTWRRGFIDRARLSYNEDNRQRGQTRTSLVEMLRVLLGHPSGRCVRALALGVNGTATNVTLDAPIGVLATERPGELRELLLGDFEQEDAEMSWYQVGNVAPIWAALPRLRRIVVRGGSFELGTIIAPELEHAEFHTGGLSRASLVAIASAAWPRLRHLDVWFGSADYGGETTLADARPLLARTDLPALVHLGLVNCEYTDDVCAIIAGSPLAAQLESLDLSRGTMSEAGVRALAEAKAALPRLAKLDVSDNFLSPAAGVLLHAAYPFATVADQRNEADWGARVVSVGE